MTPPQPLDPAGLPEMSAPAAVTAVVTPAPRTDWQQVLRADPGATVQQTPEYFSAVLRATGGRDASRSYHLADGRVLVLPLVGRTVIPGVRVEEAYPAAFDSGGLLATGGLRAEDVAVVVADLRTSGAASTRLAGDHHTAAAWEAGRRPGVVVTEIRVDVVDLTQGLDHLRARQFHRSVRKGLRKADRADVTVEVDTTGSLLPVFYDIYLAWTDRRAELSGLPRPVARRLARRREPWTKFAAVAEALGDRCRTFVARHQGRPVAACVTLLHAPYATAWRSYSVKELAAPVAANTALQVRALEDALDQGCTAYDLGQSTGVAGLQEFKQHLGAEPRHLLELRLEGPVVHAGRAVRDGVHRVAVEAVRRRSER